MTDFNTDNTDGSDRDDAGRERRRNRAKGKITEYADVKAIAESPVVEGESQTTAEERASMKALLAQMEKAMEAIDRAPDSFECIIDYGNPPLKKLGDLGNEMIRVQSKFNESVNVMGDALSQLQSGLKGMNMDKLGENAKALMNSLIKGGGKAAKGVGSFFSSLFGKKKTTTEEQKLIEEMQKALPEMLKEMLRLVHTIEETDKGLKIVITEAEKLGKARVECTRELGVYLGASKEVLRRYKDEYIPEAKEAFEASGDPQDEMYFKEVVKCQERFINRIAILEGSRAQSVIQAQQLQQMISTMEDQREKNQDIIHNSQPEWKAKYPELHVHFFNAEHFKTAANIEGIAFDNNGEPYRRIDGKIFASATFKRSEVGQSILAAEQARENEKIKERIEDGVLSDIFNSKAEPNASLDNIIKVGRALAAIDPFTATMGAFYLGVQKILGKNDGYNAIESLSPEDKKTVLAKAKEILPSDVSSIQDLVSEVLPQAKEYLDQAASIGVHTEPFRKHLAEVELYASLLNASQCFKKLKASIVSAQGADAQALVGIQEWVSKAKNQYLDLGGPIETFDRLQAWVANDNKDTIPTWIPKWIDRYYDQRQKAMKKVQERQLNVREVNVIGAKVKPPIVE